MQFQLPNREAAAPRGGGPWHTAERGWNWGSSQPGAGSWGMCRLQPQWDTSSSGTPLGSHCSLALIFLDVSLTKEAKPSILNPASILSSWKIQIKTYFNCFKQLNMHYNCSVPPSNHEKCSLVGNKWSQNTDCSYANRVSFPLKFFLKEALLKEHNWQHHYKIKITGFKI